MNSSEARVTGTESVSHSEISFFFLDRDEINGNFSYHLM
jgi:hypothetical protein